MMIYLDYCATTPISDHSLAIFQQVSKGFYGNTESLHDYGTSAKQLLEAARSELASYMNAQTECVYFTSGGTESNVLAIRSTLKGNAKRGNHIISTTMEHSSIRNTLKGMEEEGFEVTYVAPNHNGEVDLETIKQAIRPTTVLVVMTHVNSEIGVIQRLEHIGEFLSKLSICFHVDAVQSFGKLPFNVRKYNVTSAAISSHKIYGPKGVGACYMDPKANWNPVVEQTSHENGFRAGTVNVPGIAAFVSAAEECMQDMDKEKAKQTKLRNIFLEELHKSSKGAITLEEHSVNTSQLPSIIGLRLHGIEGQYVMLECTRRGIAISTGSACQIGKQSPAKTMVALGRTQDEANEFVRISFGKYTTEADVLKAATTLHDIYQSFHYKGVKHERNR
jgi:cysteine desulfurase